jgi:hypothetical protein
MDDAVKRILAKRRDRMIATILGTKEDLFDDQISREDSEEFRKVVLDQINDFFDLVIDMLKASHPDGIVVNEVWLDKIAEIHEAVVSGSGTVR